MEKKPDVGKTVILVLGGVTLLATLAAIALWLFGQQVAAAIIGTATLFGWLSLFGATIAVVVSWWSASLMERGAQIALTAEVSDDRRDIAMINAVTKLVQWKESQPDRLALPMPGQQTDWLPALNEFVDAEVSETAE